MRVSARVCTPLKRLTIDRHVCLALCIVPTRVFLRDQVSYFVVCFGLCLPILAFPLMSVHPSEAELPVGQRYGVRANLWLAIYSFIGNYWQGAK